MLRQCAVLNLISYLGKHVVQRHTGIVLHSNKRWFINIIEQYAITCYFSLVFVYAKEIGVEKQRHAFYVLCKENKRLVRRKGKQAAC
jgi:hypothetical protein